ncbi:hypothetical protein GCM10027280_27040 [Micromonospora polyrhachis]|uniref:O-antigen ligase-related domain-containing protein n=1 Tax=Micromonospora polyrhachis TaxID=1282883 RepID=A0A7W7WNN1_9ACTN|nr:O-antigen ligase family protein [Micromonospora polyrhachis]MBB4957797.1 hypothetical protein [Micromonospora polyrhachis]
MLLVHVLFETWAQVMTGPTSEDPRVNLETAAQWPKTLKSGLYLLLAALTVGKVAADRLWHRFRTGADLALLVLGLVMVLAGVLNDSSLTLMGEALFVYFRGVLIFYALRAADIDEVMVRRLLLVVGALVGLNVLVAVVQMVVGEPAYSVLGWVDLTWAEQSRAQGLLSHPNHLGHVLGLALLGFIAWAAVNDRIRFVWWLVASVVALALSATQSRESLLGVLVAGVLVAILVPRGARRVLGVCLILLVCTMAQIVARPDNRAEWERRIGNVVAGVYNPAGSERSPQGTPTGAASRPAQSTPTGAASRPAQGTQPTPTAPKTSAGAVEPKPTARSSPTGAGSPSPTPAREIRVLYLQQVVDILPRQPLLGFGIGQFGGVVAQKNNPDWHKNPKLGPEGFNRYGFQAVQIDSFWLHLVMEVGILGLVVFLAWLVLIVWPLASPLLRARRPVPRPSNAAAMLWGVTAVVFAGVAAFLSPAFEDPLLPALLWAIVGIAWWARRSDREPEVLVGAANTASADPVSDPSGDPDTDSRMRSTEGTQAVLRGVRRPVPPD